MIVKVSKEKCVGCGLCASTCGEVYEMDGDGLARAIDDEVPTALEAEAREALDSCPVSAIYEE